MRHRALILASALAAGAFATPIAGASPSRFGSPPHDPWYANVVSTTDSSGVSFTTDTLAPGGGSVSTPGYQFITDTLAPGGRSAQTPAYRFVTDTLAPGGGVIAYAQAATGFSWSDAGIGAAVTFSLLLVLFAATRHRAHRRRTLSF
jgi:hypothetical protein